jgi:hypothetical protein
MDFFLDGNNRRSYERFQSNAMVQYFFKKRSVRYMDCDLVNASRNGIAIRIPATEDIAVGMDVSLEISVPGSLDQVTVSGRIHRVQRGEKTLAGIKFDIPLERHVLDRLILR